MCLFRRSLKDNETLVLTLALALDIRIRLNGDLYASLLLALQSHDKYSLYYDYCRTVLDNNVEQLLRDTVRYPGVEVKR